MATKPVSQSIYKRTVNGNPVYDLRPDFNAGSDVAKVTDTNEVSNHINYLRSLGTYTPGSSKGVQFDASGQADSFQDVLNKYNASQDSGMVVDSAGNMTTQQAVDSASTLPYNLGGTLPYDPNVKINPPAQYPGGTTDISKTNQQSFEAAKSMGYISPTDRTGANTMFNQFSNSQQTSAVNDFISQDQNIQTLIAGYQNQMSQLSQRTSLVDTYKSMLDSSGIQGIDTELINMKNVIEGTEDDIRTEVTKAGGFASDSQVLALSNARNKQLIKNYNTLLETRNSKEQYLNTMMNLTQQDREAADQAFETQMNFGTKIIELNQTMQKNAVDSLERTAKTIGWDGVYQATQGNPQLVAQIERTYGLPQGSLAIAAQRDAQARITAQQATDLDTQYRQGQIDAQNEKQSQLTEVSPGATLFDSNTGKAVYTAPTTKQVAGDGTGGGGETGKASALTQSIIDNPSLFDDLTPTSRKPVLIELQNLGYDTSNLGVKGLSDTAIKSITDSQAALDGLMELRIAISGNEQYLGPIKGFANLNPWSKAKQIQAQIDKVKQRVGKALEGGVLRKEDEEKYKKILATIYDVPSLAQSKISGLINDVNRDIENYKSLQQSSGRSLSVNQPLSKKGQSSTGKTSTGNSYTITKE